MGIYKPGDSIFGDFFIQSPQAGSAVNADATPSGVLVRGGSDTAISVSVENKDTGLYRFGVSVPSSYNEGDFLSVRVSASVGGSLGRGNVWSGVLNASTVADNTGATGAGASVFPIVVTDENDDPISNVEVWVTTGPDPNNNIVAGTLRTDATGGASPMLDAGSPYYLWRNHTDYDFSNPLLFSVG